MDEATKNAYFALKQRFGLPARLVVETYDTPAVNDHDNGSEAEADVPGTEQSLDEARRARDAMLEKLATEGRANGHDRQEKNSSSRKHARTKANDGTHMQRCIVTFKSIKEFCAEYAPLSYVVEPIIRAGSLYTMTATTGSGKTAFLVSAVLAVTTGRADILGREVTRGRVAYISPENPDDLRMRFMVAAFRLNIDFNEVADNLVILDRRVKPEDLCAELRRLAQDRGFKFAAIDTLAASFDGTDINDNVQGGDFMRRLRPITQINGLPSVVVAAHPKKNAADDELIPYGGGAILNEVDGNLTLLRTNGALIKLHWQGKLRGIEFQPVLFRIENSCSPEVLDAKGRQVEMPVMVPASEEEAERRQHAAINQNVQILQAMLAEPEGSIRSWAATCGVNKSVVERTLPKLAKQTAAGRRAAKDFQRSLICHDSRKSC